MEPRHGFGERQCVSEPGRLNRRPFLGFPCAQARALPHVRHQFPSLAGTVFARHCVPARRFHYPFAWQLITIFPRSTFGFCSNLPWLLPRSPAGFRLHDRRATQTYLDETLTRRKDVIGKPIFEAFSDNPQTSEAASTISLRASLERVVATRKPDAMPVQRYDVPKRDGPGFELRYCDGFEIARRARATLDDAPMKLVALSGYSGPEVERKAVEAGFDLHLVKPLSVTELSTVLQPGGGKRM